MSTIVEKIYVVEGMTCGHCELSVCEEIHELAGVESVQADRTTGRLTVRGDVEDGALRASIQAAGYTIAAPSAVASGPADEVQISG